MQKQEKWRTSILAGHLVDAAQHSSAGRLAKASESAISSLSSAGAHMSMWAHVGCIAWQMSLSLSKASSLASHKQILLTALVVYTLSLLHVCGLAAGPLGTAPTQAVKRE